MIKKTLIYCIILSLAFAATTKLNAQDDERRIVDQVVAVVGNHVILQSELEEYMEQLRAQGQSVTEGTRCELLEDFLVQKLMVNEGDTIEVSESDIEMEINNRLQFFIRQIGSEEELENYFNKSIFEIKEDMRDPIREQMITQQMKNAITEDVQVTPSEVRRFYNNLSEDEIPMIPSKVQVRKIVKYPEFTEAEEYRVVQRLNEMRRRVMEGERDFETLATLYSHDRETARRGGELGFVSRSDLEPKFADVVFSLRGDRVSQVFETEYGYHIAQVLDRREEQLNVRHILLQPEIDEEEKRETKETLDSIVAEIRKDTLTFKNAARMYSEDEKTSLSGGLIINPETRGAMFEMDQLDSEIYEVVKDMSEGEISDPVEMRGDKGQVAYKVFYLSRQTRPQKATLEEHYDVIKNMALEEKEDRVLQEWIRDQQQNTFIKIMDDYKNCSFTNEGWLDN